jgi:hypothetical protein
MNEKNECINLENISMDFVRIELFIDIEENTRF